MTVQNACYEHENRDRAPPPEGGPLRGAISFFDVQMRYRPELPLVLRGVSFAIDEGSVCALVGKSGGGKSTMIHLLLRYYDPAEGE